MFASPFSAAVTQQLLPVVLVIYAKRCQVTYFLSSPLSLSHAPPSFEGKLSNARTWYLSLAFSPFSFSFSALFVCLVFILRTCQQFLIWLDKLHKALTIYSSPSLPLFPTGCCVGVLTCAATVSALCNFGTCRHCIMRTRHSQTRLKLCNKFVNNFQLRPQIASNRTTIEGTFLQIPNICQNGMKKQLEPDMHLSNAHYSPPSLHVLCYFWQLLYLFTYLQQRVLKVYLLCQSQWKLFMAQQQLL